MIGGFSAEEAGMYKETRCTGKDSSFCVILL